MMISASTCSESKHNVQGFQYTDILLLQDPDHSERTILIKYLTIAQLLQIYLERLVWDQTQHIDALVNAHRAEQHLDTPCAI